MSTQYGTLLLVGSGPGIGRNVAKLFASKGFQQVILLSRNTSRLEEDAAYVKSAASGVQVHTVTVDLAEKSSIDKALAQVEKHLEKTPLQVVHYNAARVGESKFFETGVEELESDLRITVSGLYTVASWSIPRLQSLSTSQPALKPAFLVTSGLLYKEPFPQLFTLSTSKAAQYSLVQSMYKEFGPKGVHCAMVVVGGVVKDDAKVTTAARVAEEFWGLFTQDGKAGRWELERTILDPEYEDMVRASERKGETW